MSERADKSRKPSANGKHATRSTTSEEVHADQRASVNPSDAILRLQRTIGNRATVHMTDTDSRRVQRDVVAYNKEQTEFLPNMGDMMGGGGMSQYSVSSAEAPAIRAALKDLIDAGKIKEVQSTKGTKSWFAANHHKNAQLPEIRKALVDAGYSDADKIARAIYDIHGEYLYSKGKIVTSTLFGSHETEVGKKLQTQGDRAMTEYEIRQASRVFGGAIDYSKVQVSDGSVSAEILSAGGYARTIGNTINFPDGASRDMALMIHELTHVWQYQHFGWKYAPQAIKAQIFEGYEYADEGKSAEQTLKDARAAGKTIHSYNREQQGDILQDYFKRLQKGDDTSAWEPFVNDVRNS